MMKDYSLLKKKTLESAIYIAAFSPKMQKDVVEIVYNRPSEKVNMKRFVTARDNLLRLNYIKTGYSGDMRRHKLISVHSPFVTYIKKDYEKRNKKSIPFPYALDKEDITFLQKFFDSDWFRNTFFNTDAMRIMATSREPIEYDEKNVLRISAFGVLGQIFTDILSITDAFSRKIEEYLPQSESIRNVKSFDKFIEIWYKDKLVNINKIGISKVIKYLNSYDSEYMRYLAKKSLEKPYPALCIPQKFWPVSRRIVRHYSSYNDFVIVAVNNYL